jgi:hypothetical protein
MPAWLQKASDDNMRRPSPDRPLSLTCSLSIIKPAGPPRIDPRLNLSLPCLGHPSPPAVFPAHMFRTFRSLSPAAQTRLCMHAAIVKYVYRKRNATVDLASKECSFELKFSFPNFIVNGTTKFGSEHTNLFTKLSTLLGSSTHSMFSIPLCLCLRLLSQ